MKKPQMTYQGSELSNNKALLSSLGIQEGSTVSLCDAAQVPCLSFVEFFTSLVAIFIMLLLM